MYDNLLPTDKSWMAYGCTCPYCLNIARTKYHEAKEAWDNGTREIQFSDWDTGEDWGTEMSINGCVLSNNIEGNAGEETRLLLEFLGIDDYKINMETEDYD